ncbi:MAG: FISUMP domain-containing protein [Bacteroidia bacterium]
MRIPFVRIILITCFCLGSALMATQQIKNINSLEANTPPMDQIVDQRDGKEYTFLKLGELYWLKENLNYETLKSECYEARPENCAKYGRLYSFDDSKIACPQGWKLPTVSQWKSLRKSMKSAKADKIIVPGEWQGEEFENATNELELSVLPGGRKDEHGPASTADKFTQMGISSSYWLDHQAYHWHIRWGKSHIHKHGDISLQGRKFYIRCVCETLPE